MDWYVWLVIIFSIVYGVAGLIWWCYNLRK